MTCSSKRDSSRRSMIARSLRREVWPLVERGVVAPVIDRTFPLVEAAAAHRRMESGDHVGKIVLTC